MMNEDWVKKLLKLCEQKHGQDAPAMRQLRCKFDEIRQAERYAMLQTLSGRTLASTADR